MKPALVLVVAAALVAAAAVKRYSYEDPLDAWQAFTKESKDAATGNPFAMHTCFVAAYVRLNDPKLGGADLEEMTSSTEKIIANLGDQRFADALRLERPEIIAAVAYFVQPERLSGYPVTRHLFETAPKIQWQLNQATGDTDRSPLLKKFIEFEESGKGW